MTPEQTERARGFKAAVSVLAKSNLMMLSMFEDGELLIVLAQDEAGLREQIQELARRSGLSQPLVLTREHYGNLVDRERCLTLDILGQATQL